jgi:putative sterol carrier protein
MSTEAGRHTLAEYVEALIEALRNDDPGGLSRMRELVGARAARIELDEEAIEVVFIQGALRIASKLDFAVDGTGSTDSATVLEILDGELEVSAAVLDGKLRLFGEAENIARMCSAIEILLNASVRSPTLQSLASRFRRERETDGAKVDARYPIRWYPFASTETELHLLSRLDLLPGPHET